MTRAFVILLHTGCGEDHFDLMLDPGQGRRLATWRCGVGCLSLRPGEAAVVRRLADHRRAYLTYEGPVSGGRGMVRRVARGTYETLDDQPGRLVVRLDAEGKPPARLELTQAEGDRWVITRSGDVRR